MKALLYKVAALVLRCNRSQKRAIMMLCDAVALPILLWVAFALR